MASKETTRRTFLKTASAGSLAAAGGFSFLSQLPLVSADDLKVKPGLVQFDRQIEPLVRLIEESPRESLLEKVAEKIRQGTSYRQVLAALLLAGVRNVQPYPAVGFKFHCVLVVNSCHLASLSGPVTDRWLPLFWALDYFKSSQADEKNQSGWRMSAANEGAVPAPHQAKQLFHTAMQNWDVDKADAATAGLVRSAGATDVFNAFAKYAARDYRSIGHKAIYLANSWRTLQVIGWQYAEPVLRSLTFALLNHNGQPNPGENDLAVDRPWRENGEKLKQLPANWLSGKLAAAATNDLIAACRQESTTAVSDVAVAAIMSGVGPQSIWDGVFVSAGELLMRQPGIIGLHGLTTANALHYLYRNVANDKLRQRLLLQACSFNPLFRESAKSRGALSASTIDSLKPISPVATGEAAVTEIMGDISSNKSQAAAKIQGYLEAGGAAHDLVDAARRVLFRKGRNAHDYKFSSAVLEDFAHVSPSWRNTFMALSVYNLRGTGDRDSQLLQRTQAVWQ